MFFSHVIIKSYWINKWNNLRRTKFTKPHYINELICISPPSWLYLSELLHSSFLQQRDFLSKLAVFRVAPKGTAGEIPVITTSSLLRGKLIISYQSRFYHLNAAKPNQIENHISASSL